MIFNTLFKIELLADKEEIGGDRNTATLGSDIRFTFTEERFTAKGVGVDLQYPRNRIGAFEAEAI